MSGNKPVAPQKTELSLRVSSAIVMAIGGIVSAWWGGWAFIFVWTAISYFTYCEWQAMTEGRPDKPLADFDIIAGFSGLMFIGFSFGNQDQTVQTLGLTLLVFSVMIALLRRNTLPVWAGGGFLYAGLLLVSVLLLRAAPQGFITILFLFLVVWGADVGAYFAGRHFGGPKLAPRISPNKTWSGFLGGMITGILAGLVLLALFGVPLRFGHAVLAGLLAIASALGDLFESGMKRRFGVKDSGTLIPGHGGVMDRLDGFVFAAILACLIGLMQAGRPGGSFNPLSAF